MTLWRASIYFSTNDNLREADRRLLQRHSIRCVLLMGGGGDGEGLVEEISELLCRARLERIASRYALLNSNITLRTPFSC